MRTASEPVERWAGAETLARLERAVAEPADVAAPNSFQTGAAGPQTVAHAATRKEDGTTPKPDGFYVVELTSDGRILNDNIYGPYANAVDAELAAREGYT